MATLEEKMIRKMGEALEEIFGRVAECFRSGKVLESGPCGRKTGEVCKSVRTLACLPLERAGGTRWRNAPEEGQG